MILLHNIGANLNPHSIGSRLALVNNNKIHSTELALKFIKTLHVDQWHYNPCWNIR